MAGSTATIPQFKTMTIDELHRVRDEAFAVKVRELDLETRQWLTGYVDALIAHVDGDAEGFGGSG